MNKREEWSEQNQYMEQYVCPQPHVPSIFTSANNWVQIPPQTMPWGLPSNSHPPVVRFTAGDFIPQHHPVKRKLASDYEMRPAKQLVTEEKMAAHMSNLHISDSEIPRLNQDVDLSDEAMDTDRLPKLVLSDELKNFKAEPIIPEAILNKIERPKMAVVLWKPPSANDLTAKLAEIKKIKSKDREEKDESTTVFENNNVDSTFRPIDPVPMHPVQENQYLQPQTPQFHRFFPFS